MAPGILILGGENSPGGPQPEPAATTTALKPGMAKKRGQMRSAVASGSPKEPSRPDSPGYFTLSDSDGASNPGAESPHEDEASKASKPSNGHQVYKLFKNNNNNNLSSKKKSPPKAYTFGNRPKSTTPPRPSPPKNYRRESLEMSDPYAPPRPPPPLTYTSTLPPPVPKKVGRAKTPGKDATFSSRTLPSSSSTVKKSPSVQNGTPSSSSRDTIPNRTIPRVQPLQVQSPSMIKALTGKDASPSPTTTKKSPPRETAKPQQQQQTFVLAFQRAYSQRYKDANGQTSSASSSRRSSVTTTTTSARTTSKPSSARPASAGPTASRTLSSAQRTSPTKDIPKRPASLSKGKTAEASKPKKPSVAGNALKKTSESVRRSLQNLNKKAVSLKTPTPEPKRPTSATNNNKVPSSRSSSASESSDEKRPSSLRQSSSRSSVSPPTRTTKSLSATCIDKIKEKAEKHKSQKKSPSPIPNPKRVQAEKRPESSHVEEIKETSDDKADKEKEKVVVEISEMSDPNKKPSSILLKPINALIKYYENRPVMLRDKDSDSSSFVGNYPSGGGLSQLSMFSTEQLQSWLSNPMVDCKDQSITEIDVLDQYISQMMSFTRDTLSDVQAPIAVTNRNSEAFLSILENVRDGTDSGPERQSVQEIINKIESAQRLDESSSKPPKDPAEVTSSTEISQKSEAETGAKVNVQERPPEKPERKKRSGSSCTNRSNVVTPVPSEADLSHGVFTEVSFAGSFSSCSSNVPPVTKSLLVPVPSPRTKRKARKEQMLQEHKEKGREALSNLLKRQSDGDGMECLDELCSQSRNIIMLQQQQPEEEVKSENCDVSRFGPANKALPPDADAVTNADNRRINDNDGTANNGDEQNQVVQLLESRVRATESLCPRERCANRLSWAWPKLVYY